MFERLTFLNSYNLDDHAFSIAASEAAIEAEDDAETFALILKAKKLRKLEFAQVHENASSPSLDKLRTLADLQDNEEDEFKAYHAVREEIERMVAA